MSKASLDGQRDTLGPLFPRSLGLEMLGRLPNILGKKRFSWEDPQRRDEKAQSAASLDPEANSERRKVGASLLTMPLPRIASFLRYDSLSNLNCSCSQFRVKASEANSPYFLVCTASCRKFAGLQEQFEHTVRSKKSLPHP